MPNYKISKTSVAMKFLQPLHSENSDNCYFHCKIESCKALLSGKKKCNLVKHFTTQHAAIFNEEWRKVSDLGEANSGELERRRLEYIQQLTQIVTVNGRPFKCLTDSGIMGIGARELKYLHDAGYGDGLTGYRPHAVLNHIEYLSAEIIKAIQLEVKNSLVSLMVDVGSKNGRDILGLSIQYMRDDCIILRSIGMIQLTSSHTAVNINAEIISCLQKFDIKPSQVISITSDNASNMLAMVKIFNLSSGSDSNENAANGVNCESDASDENDKSEQSEDWMENANIYDDEYITTQINSIIEEFNSIKELSSEELHENEKRAAEIQEILDDSSHYLDLLKLLQNEFAVHTLNSSGIRCAAHTLQLAIQKALKGTKVRVIIDMCRIACKLLRKASYKNRMREQNLGFVSPRLDCKIRWNSTYRMVSNYIFYFNSLYPDTPIQIFLLIICIIRGLLGCQCTAIHC